MHAFDMNCAHLIKLACILALQSFHVRINFSLLILQGHSTQGLILFSVMAATTTAEKREYYSAVDVEHYFNYMGMLAEEVGLSQELCKWMLTSVKCINMSSPQRQGSRWPSASDKHSMEVASSCKASAALPGLKIERIDAVVRGHSCKGCSQRATLHTCEV